MFIISVFSILGTSYLANDDILNGYFLYKEEVSILNSGLNVSEFSFNRTYNYKLKCGTKCLESSTCNTFDVCQNVCRIWNGEQSQIGGSSKICKRYMKRKQAYNVTQMIAEISTSVTTQGVLQVYCSDCSCASSTSKENGTYTVIIDGAVVNVSCIFYAGESWTIIQSRVDGSLNFLRNWNEYEEGFGSVEKEFWLGNRFIHNLTLHGNTFLRIDMTDRFGNDIWATYSNFQIDGPDKKYRLHVSGFSGNAGDSLGGSCSNYCHDGMMFTTVDADNDQKSGSCAQKHRGAWWYNNCYYSNLNGEYGNTSPGKGVLWYKHKNSQTDSLSRVRIMIRHP